MSDADREQPVVFHATVKSGEMTLYESIFSNEDAAKEYAASKMNPADSGNYTTNDFRQEGPVEHRLRHEGNRVATVFEVKVRDEAAEVL